MPLSETPRSLFRAGDGDSAGRGFSGSSGLFLFI